MITFKAKTKSGELIKSALTPFTFPAGEAHIKREDRRELEPTEIAIVQSSADSLHNDLFHLDMWNNYIETENIDNPPNGPSKRVLVIPYFPGARADRGNPFGLRTYANFIWAMGLNQIILFDPHSGVTGDELHAGSNLLTIVHSEELLSAQIDSSEYVGLIAPDKGAVERTNRVGKAMGLPVYRAGKTRNESTGKLTGFHMEDPLPAEGKLLVVDDICDGGGTFLGLADSTGLPPERLDLYVSHGVFSGKALSTLPYKFGKVMTTNSYNPKRMLEGDLMGDAWGDDDPAIPYAEMSAKFKRFDVTRLLLDKIV